MRADSAEKFPGEPTADSPAPPPPSDETSVPPGSASTVAESSGSAPASSSTTKECRYCGETLRADAVTCRFCGRDQFSENASRLVFAPGEWDTEVPKWMQEEEERLKRRWLLKKKLRRMQWPFVGTLLACGLTVILWRLFTAPPEPHMRLLVAQRLPARHKPSPTPVEVGTPEPPAVSSESPGETGGAASSASATPVTTVSSPSPASNTAAPVAAPTLEASPDAATDDSSDEPAISMDATDLAGDFQDHRPFAEDKYNGRPIQVTGQIREIDTSGNTPFILFNTGGRPPVKCFLTKAAKKELYRVSPGKLASLRGTCDGAFLEIIISDCNFVF